MTPQASVRLRSAALAASTATLLVVGFAAPANAVVSVSGNYVQSDGAGDNITVGCVAGLLDANGVTGDACASMTSLTVELGGGTDSVTLSGVTATAFPALTTVFTTANDSSADSVTGSPIDDNITGDSTDTVSGAGGNDLISAANIANGGAGDDSFMEIRTFASGGDGDDRFIQFTSTAGVEGGPGVDSWELDFDQATLGAGAVTFTMSATALDVDIVDDALPAAVVPATNLEQIFFTLLRQGTQTYAGSAFPGTQHVRGMAGPDTIVGGAADDALFGGGGADAITGGAGVDVLSGGNDNDTIQARDAVADRVDCGAGADSVVADAVDVIVNCETVEVPPVVSPPVVTPPVVTPVTGAVTGPAKVTRPKAAKFKFSSTTAGATFQCKVDGKTWKVCASPYKVATKKLKLGKHTLLVRAVVGSAVDATPSKKVFKVVKG